MQGFGRKAAAIGVAMSLALVGVACGGSSDDAGGGDGGGGLQADLGYDDEGSGASSEAQPADPDEVANENSAALGVGNSVIKTAHIDLEVERDGFSDAHQGVLRVADSTGGYLLSSDVAGEESRRGSFTIRVPATRFEAAMADLNDLGEVTNTRTRGEDVSEEFIDLEARIRNLEAQEAVILRLMNRARSIPTSIRIQNELSRIQLDIERLRGRLRFLEDQTSYGTITVGIVELGAGPAPEPSDLARAWDVAAGTVTNIAGVALIGTSVVVPIGVLLVLLFFLVRWVKPRFGRLTP